MFLKSNLRRTFRSSKACQGSSRGGGLHGGLEKRREDRPMAVFRPIPDSLCASSSFLPYVGRFGQLVGRCHAIRVFFRLQKKGEGNRGRRKRKRPPPFCFPCRSVCFFPLFANGLAPPPMPICQIYGASGGGTEKRRRRRERKGGSTPNNQAESDTFSCIPSSANS